MLSIISHKQYISLSRQILNYVLLKVSIKLSIQNGDAHAQSYKSLFVD